MKKRNRSQKTQLKRKLVGDCSSASCEVLAEIPSRFEIKGPSTTRIYTNFEDSTFVWNIIETLGARGYSILPNG